MGWLMWCYQLVCLQLVLLHSLSFANLCSNEQSSALLHFKQLFSFSNHSSSSFYCEYVLGIHSYPKMMDWKEDTDCCSWDGITCDRVTGHVIGLNLSCSWLHGTIPSNTSLFLLSHLQKLDLALNDFNHSQIPSDFVRFSSLTHLNLSYSNFSGQVPLEISHLSKLTSLRLRNLPAGVLTLEIETLVMEGLVQNMSQLQELSLRCVNMSTVALGTLTNINLPSLKFLSLARCELQGTIPSGLFSDLPSLETIYLYGNQLSGLIPSGLFSDLPSLETISLSGNQLSGLIPSGLFSDLPSLETIYLYGNQLSGPIPSSIFELVNLTHLDLSSNHLSGTVELYMFAKLKNLEDLDLSRNSLSISTSIKVNSSFPKLHYLILSSCNINEFPEILSTADNLRYLDLSDNKIHGHIPNWLFNITTLSSLDLSHNFLTGSIEQLPRKGLRYLDLSLNQLSGPIPSSISELVNLTYHDLSHNSLSMSTTIKVNSSFPKLNILILSSCNINEFPEIFSTAENLRWLELSDNKIHGHIPNWLFNISTLSSLDLSHNFLTGIEQLPWKGLQSLDLDLSFNQLSGPIPSSIFELVNLTSLDLSHNSLSMSTTIKVNSSFPNLNSLTLSSCNINEFPEILSTVENLQSLDLSDNKIHGQIPNWLFNISTLSFLNVSHNFLTGIEQLPWKGIQYLDLHSNLLQGLLPPPPPKLYFFSVSHNILTGAIPSSFCNLSSLQYLDLSNNSLSGVIPQCLGNSSNIWVLDLKMNNFHGSIPQTFANGCQLTTLNLNSNRLAGSLPPSLANCGNLEVLDVGNNKINGTFPHWLATLPQLQVLILRSNRFYGALGDSTTRLRFSMLRILDLSHNSFTGHLQTRFFRKFQAMMSGKNNSADMRYMGDNLYKDSIMLTMKGFEIEMQRVLTIFTAMDLSSNRFQGRILDVVGKLNSLIVLNFSHNSLIGHIPLSMGNLMELESLDLSSNKLDGKIPQELTSLTFLSVLNLSYNHLVGPIPQGNQFHTFQNDSYFGNLGLCGLPMSETCSNDEPLESQPTIFQKEHDNSSWFEWKIIMMGYGSGIVIGLSIGHIVFSTGKPWWFVSMVERKVIKLTRSRRRRRN